jgi:hypothetical protein
MRAALAAVCCVLTPAFVLPSFAEAIEARAIDIPRVPSAPRIEDFIDEVRLKADTTPGQRVEGFLQRDPGDLGRHAVSLDAEAVSPISGTSCRSRFHSRACGFPRAAPVRGASP